MRSIKLKDATEDEIKKHYEQASSMRNEFDNIRPSFYMTHGTFNSDPLISHYKEFMYRKGITMIAIDD